VATLCSAMFLEANGVHNTVDAAIELYESITNKSRMIHLRYWASMASSGPRKEPRWPIRTTFRAKDKKGGLANVMLWLACLELAKGGINTHRILADCIKEFLTKGMERKKLALKTEV